MTYPSSMEYHGFLSGLLAARPAAAIAERLYWATDVQMLYRDTGAAWDAVGHGNLANVTFAQHHDHYSRYLYTEMFEYSSTQTLSANFIYYSPIVVPTLSTIDGIGAIHSATGAGNFYVAIYDSVAESPVNRLAVSASTAAPGANQKQIVPIVPATLQLQPGYYFLSLNADNTSDVYPVTNSVLAAPAGSAAHGPGHYDENLGGYVIPPVTATPTPGDIFKFFIMYMRTSSTP